MDNSLTTVEGLIERGIQERFTETFDGCPLVFTNTSNKKEVVAKLLETKEIPYPFAIASFATMAIPEGPTSYKPHTLLRRGLIGQTSSDHTLAYKVGLIPCDIMYEVHYFHTGQTEIKRYAKKWLFATLGAKLNTTVTYGVANLDIRVDLDRSVTIPTREANPSEQPEYDITSNFLVHGYLSEDLLGKVQAVTNIQVDINALDKITYEALNQDGKDNVRIFLFNKPWSTVAGPQASTGDTLDAFPSK
jgi:hypothetical protein